MTAYIKSKPIGKYTRRLWFFYEMLSGRELPLEDCRMGNYIDALDDRHYFTLRNGQKSPRHRVVNNLPGVSDFCPVVRRTENLTRMESIDLRKKCDEIITAYPESLIRRALGYLYRKETKSSFAIEQVHPNASRIERFIAALALAENEDFCEKEHLISLQNRIVDPRFQDKDYRVIQNFVGQTVVYQRERVHYVSPKPEDLARLMSGLVATNQRMKTGAVSAVVHAAVVAYGLVFLHPFEDGNGRIHRFLIHNILSLRGSIPKGMIFPVSATMLKNPADYDASLEAFSRPLMQVVEYPRQALLEIIDMPDRLMDQFIQFCLQHHGCLSERKGASHFDFLTDAELHEMEMAVQVGYSLEPSTE